MAVHYATTVLEDKKQSPQTDTLTTACLTFWKRFGKNYLAVGVSFIIDSGSPDTARQTTNCLGTSGTEMPAHPPRSLDLVPWDFYLLPSIK
ncbi:hypothetical protein EVAR_45775_1 [Eumeta japonica]|uniref:Uncharacterized protein n=1 Tax=Eumeta variegata TaxID=151549 RepID=A0A4C1X1R2_EUMVA|nr:hypothetical protein EVAR_45775_1 [Eumeta japonica]